MEGMKKDGSTSQTTNPMAPNNTLSSKKETNRSRGKIYSLVVENGDDDDDDEEDLANTTTTTTNKSNNNSNNNSNCEQTTLEEEEWNNELEDSSSSSSSQEQHIGSRITSILHQYFHININPTQQQQQQYFIYFYKFLTSNILSDIYIPSWNGMKLLDGIEAIRLIKFAFITLIFILLTHPLVRFMGYEHDPYYTIMNFFQYDFNFVLLDLGCFFLVGRLHQRQGIDRIIPILLPMAIGTIYPSWISTIWFLQHSLTLYEIVCTWPWQLYVYVLVSVFISAYVIHLHIQLAYQTRTLLCRGLEFITLAFFCLLLPIMTMGGGDSFHLHHWYFSWFVGMHFNQSPWWSQMTMAFCWGQYINGIAVYGRDPLFGCDYAYYVSTDIRCSYMECNLLDDDSVMDDDDGNGYKPYVPSLDWRNCSGTH